MKETDRERERERERERGRESEVELESVLFTVLCEERMRWQGEKHKDRGKEKDRNKRE